MTEDRNWLVNFDPKKKSIVKFVDNRVTKAEGIGNVIVKIEDGKKTVLT